MNNCVAEYTSALGGLPFVDAGFRPNILLAVTAGVRRRYDLGASAPLDHYLDPGNARRLFLLYGKSRVDEPASRHLTGSETAAVDVTIDVILGIQPAWEPLLTLPVQYRALLDGRVSVTSALIPQAIYLGAVALQDQDVLADVLVHEFSHLWLNLLAETSDLQTSNSRETYILPSGTPGKSARGVMLAAHFAAATHAFHSSKTADSPKAAYRFNYLRGCLELLKASRDITPMGNFVISRLSAYARSRSQS